FSFFFFHDTSTTDIYTLSLHDALPILIKFSFLLVYLAPGPFTFPLILRTLVGVSALEVTVMAFLMGPTLLVSYFTSICPVFPGCMGASGFLGMVQPQLDFTLLITKGALPMLVNSNTRTPLLPFSISP